MTELTTVEKAKQALSLGCELKMQYSYDAQCVGGSWHVKARDFSRVTGGYVWLDLGYVSGNDKTGIEKYAKERGFTCTEKQQQKRSRWPEPYFIHGAIPKKRPKSRRRRRV